MSAVFPRRSYGLRLSCSLALFLFVLGAFGAASLGWHAKTCYEHYCTYLNMQHQLQMMRIIYRQKPVIEENDCPDLIPEPIPMEENMQAGPDCGPKG